MRCIHATNNYIVRSWCHNNVLMTYNGVVVSLTPTQMMILMVHCLGLWFCPSTLVHLVFFYTPLFRVRVLCLNLPMAIHINIYYADYLAWFLFTPTLGARIVSCFLQNNHAFWLFNLDLSFDSLLSTHSFIDYCMIHGSLLKNQDQNTGCPDLYLQI